ncbi:MAG: DUF2249 domain-containing protein [Firmicutes bacterium]|nr:DUF2249 domain-containing protein [Bacillota bacterium]
MKEIDLRGLPASERRPKIQEAVEKLNSGDEAVLLIQHEDFFGALPKTIEGFQNAVEFKSITFGDNYTLFKVLVQKK